MATGFTTRQVKDAEFRKLIHQCKLRGISFRVENGLEGYRPAFTIGVQTFVLSDVDTPADAWWFIKMMAIAFLKIKTNNNEH